MKRKLITWLASAALISCSTVASAQAPTLGTSADFVLFTSVGAVTNTGITHLTGQVGTNSGASTGFGNVDGAMHDQDAASALAATNVLAAYLQLNATVATLFPGPLLGNGQTLTSGIYEIATPATMNLDLTLDGQNNPNAVFIIRILGTLSANAGTKVHLTNGALACNVFWQVEGVVSLATNTTMRGTIIANNAAINMNTGDTLEGRALSTNGAISVSGTMAYIPTGCGSLPLTGPIAPALGAVECYTLFSSDGPVTNVGATYVTGDIGTNLGSTLGFNPLFVTGTIHPIPDGSTAAAATDLNTAYLYLNTLPHDIELLYPAQFGNSLVLTPHTYLMNSAVTFTDSLFLNAQGDPNAVFVIKIYGAMNTSTYANVVLQNGAQAHNVYWLVVGAVGINDYSIFKGTIVCSNGAMSLNTGMDLQGRALTTVGALNTSAITAVSPFVGAAAGLITGSDTVCQGQTGVGFSVPAMSSASGYNWTVPNGYTITSGLNTDSITVDFSLSAVSDTIFVYGANACGLGSDTAYIVVTVLPGLTMAGIISGPDTVCAGQTGVLYTTTPIPNATSYVWTLPIGVTITAGLNTDSITVDFGALATSGAFTVQGTSLCGAGPMSINFDVTVLSLTAPAGLIIGPDTVCAGQSGVIYSVLPIAGATNYIWTLPSGATIVAGANTDSITVDFSLSAVSGNFTVQGSNYCDTGIVSINLFVTIQIGPSAAGNITGPDTVCAGQTGVVYSVTPIPNATSYNWTIPGAVTITSGANTNTITVDFGITAVSGNFSVQGGNSCGTGTVSSNLFVTVLVAPSAATNIIGPDSVCTGQTGVIYSVLPIANATTYNWTFPSGVIIVSGGTTDSVTIDFGSSAVSGIITVQGVNACGFGTVSTSFSVTVLPTPASQATSNTPICLDSTILLSAQTITGSVVTYTWSGPNGYTSTAQNPTIPSASVTDAGSYSLTVTADGCTSVETTTAVVVEQCGEIDFHIPEGFSPNGDGTNDVFVIRGILYYPNNTFVIYNRWGNLVYEATPYTNTWDGKATSGLILGGDELPVGTYFYVLDLGNGTPIYKGTIYLNR